MTQPSGWNESVCLDFSHFGRNCLKNRQPAQTVSPNCVPQFDSRTVFCLVQGRIVSQLNSAVFTFFEGWLAGERSRYQQSENDSSRFDFQASSRHHLACKSVIHSALYSCTDCSRFLLFLLKPHLGLSIKAFLSAMGQMRPYGA